MDYGILSFYYREIVICVLLLLLFVWQLIDYYYNDVALLRWYKALKEGKLPVVETFQPISVIVYAEENAEELRQTLPALLAQDYPAFEVIVVNDGKTDLIKDYVTALQQTYSNLYHTYVPENAKYISRRKLALTIGTKAAHYEWIATTVAGAVPSSDKWLKGMAAHLTEQTELLLGYSNFLSSNSLCSRYIAYDGLVDSVTYLSAAVHAHPFKGDGRNLFYRKSLFFSKSGFRSHLNLKSGEDDLFVNELATSANTRICCTPDTLMRQPISSRLLWRNHKHKYAASARFYKRKSPLFRRSRSLSLYLFYAAVLVLLFSSIVSHWIFSCIGALFFLLRYAALQYYRVRLYALLSERADYCTWLLFELCRPFVDLYYRCGRFGRDYTWKI